MEEVRETSRNCRKCHMKLKSTEFEIDSYVPLHFDCDKPVLKLSVLLEELRHTSQSCSTLRPWNR